MIDVFLSKLIDISFAPFDDSTNPFGEKLLINICRLDLDVLGKKWKKGAPIVAGSELLKEYKLKKIV